MKNKQAFKLFINKERRQLFGHKGGNLIAMTFITLVALLSIGFATASMKYLEKRMNDPFVTCVDIDVDQIWSKGYENLRDFVEAPERQQTYNFFSPEEVFLISEKFYDADGLERQLDGRTFSMSSPLREGTILSASNVIQVRYDTLKDEDFGIIISQTGLEKLKLNSPAFLTQTVVTTDEEGTRKKFDFSVPVLAIVKQLPNMCDFMVTRSYALHEIGEAADHFNLSNDIYQRNLTFICLDADAQSIVQNIPSNFKTKTEPDFSSWSNDYSLITVTSTNGNSLLYDSIYSILKNKNPQIQRLYPFLYTEVNNDRVPQLYSCYFKKDSLQYKVEIFSAQLEKELNYKLDMSKINNLKNLAYVQQMGNTLSICIVLIAIIFICVFIYFLLNMHFRKIQKNLGTFKAFGIDNKMLYTIYLSIMFELILFAYIIALGLTLTIAVIVNNLPFNYNIDYFAWQYILLLILAIVASFIATYFVAHNLLTNTPGDLIYNRNNK